MYAENLHTVFSCTNEKRSYFNLLCVLIHKEPFTCLFRNLNCVPLSLRQRHIYCRKCAHGFLLCKWKTLLFKPLVCFDLLNNSIVVYFQEWKLLWRPSISTGPRPATRTWTSCTPSATELSWIVGPPSTSPSVWTTEKGYNLIQYFEFAIVFVQSFLNYKKIIWYWNTRSKRSMVPASLNFICICYSIFNFRLFLSIFLGILKNESGIETPDRNGQWYQHVFNIPQMPYTMYVPL